MKSRPIVDINDDIRRTIKWLIELSENIKKPAVVRSKALIIKNN